MKKKIGITQRVYTHSHGERWDALAQDWSLFFDALGFQIIPIPNRILDVSEFIAMAGLTGIVLSGGGDLGKYGGEAPERDVLERAILDYATQTPFPVIGVCRGFQAIHDYFGGELIKIQEHVGTMHAVNSKSHQRFVNSFHNWGIKHVPQGLVTTATSQDGYIEAFAHERNLICGVMWHPERISPLQIEDLELFAGLFDNFPASANFYHKVVLG